MPISINRLPGRLVQMFVVTTLIRALVLPASVAEAAMIPWPDFLFGTSASAHETAAAPTGIELATVGGNALMSPQMPVTLASASTPDWSSTAGWQPPVITPKVIVPSGTTFRPEVTAYSSTPDQTDGDPFTTASGTHVHDGTIATNFLPFGTRVKFPDYSGDKVYVVEDRMNPKFSSRADIWFPTREAALHFGKRPLTMVVVNE